jgi:RNA polymerase sigma-70 factor, ECF subfamily
MRLSRHQQGFSSGTGTRLDSPDLEHIYAEYLDPIYRFLYTSVGNREDTEDLTSQVFLKAFLQLDVARTERSIASWLFTVARTVLADYWRLEYRHGPMAQFNENLAHRMDAQAESDDAQTIERVNRVLALLSVRSRAVLELRFLRGYSVMETARALSINPGNVKVIQHRALAKAAALMGDGTSSSTRSAPGRQRLPEDRREPSSDIVAESGVFQLTA